MLRRKANMLADTLRQLGGVTLRDGKGRQRVLELLPPATAAEISAIEAAVPAPLPDEIRAALRVSTGLANGPLESFSLIDLEGFGLEEVFPHAYSIAHDGCGNYWVLDLLSGSPAWGPVFFACHDPPVIVYQADSVEHFLTDVVAMWQPGARSPVETVRDDVVHHIWKDDADLITPAAAREAGDAALAAFASSLPVSARIADLRQARIGDGFAWGRHGRHTVLRRAGTERIWAIMSEEKPGFFRRVFGRS